MPLDYFDAHNHLQDNRLIPLRDGYQEQHPSKAVVNGTTEKDWPTVLDLARQHHWIVPSLGLHPWFVRERSPDWLATLQSHLEQQPCALGEIGLDRWIENPDVAAQRDVFAAQLSLATKHHLPASIHCLKAWGLLDEMLRAEQPPSCGFLLHSYGGPAEMVRGFLDLGAYFSISGYFAHQRKSRQREVFKSIPMDRLLVETDAPDMPPPETMDAFQLRDGDGKSVNHPGNLESIYRFAATFREQSLEDFTGQVAQNFRTLFRTVLQ